jgi:hypothetical protein
LVRGHVVVHKNWTWEPNWKTWFVATTLEAGGNWKEFDWSALVSKANVKTALMHERNAIAGSIRPQREQCKLCGSYLGQLIEGLERWQRQRMRLWLSFSEWHYCPRKKMHDTIEVSAEEAVA